jgi:hypothetical protein
MKGANPVLERKTSRANMRKTAINGMSHHFLFSFMKPQRSVKKPMLACSAAACSNSDFCGSLFTPVKHDYGWSRVESRESKVAELGIICQILALA